MNKLRVIFENGDSIKANFYGSKADVDNFYFHKVWNISGEMVKAVAIVWLDKVFKNGGIISMPKEN